jgi:hypothetical protein
MRKLAKIFTLLILVSLMSGCMTSLAIITSPQGVMLAKFDKKIDYELQFKTADGEEPYFKGEVGCEHIVAWNAGVGWHDYYREDKAFAITNYNNSDWILKNLDCEKLIKGNFSNSNITLLKVININHAKLYYTHEKYSASLIKESSNYRISWVNAPKNNNSEYQEFGPFRYNKISSANKIDGLKDIKGAALLYSEQSYNVNCEKNGKYIKPEFLPISMASFDQNFSYASSDEVGFLEYDSENKFWKISSNSNSIGIDVIYSKERFQCFKVNIDGYNAYILYPYKKSYMYIPETNTLYNFEQFYPSQLKNSKNSRW